LAHKFIFQTTLLQTKFTQQQGKHAIDSSKSDEAQKVFVGPDFWLTKHYSNMVRKFGVLQ
jgi:hypothetical protein